MIHYEFLDFDRVLILSPEGAIEADDFQRIAREVDPLIEDGGPLNGVMIRAESFPGWEDFAALSSHLKFVRAHHREIGRVAMVSDSKVLSLAPYLVDHFVAAEVRHFDFNDQQAALDWLRSG